MSLRCRPNFFTGFKLTSREFVENVNLMQQAMILSHPHLTKCLTPAAKLHITGSVMELKTADDINSAISCFQTSIPQILELIGEPNEFRINFGKINSFGNKVLYLDPLPGDNLDVLLSIQATLTTAFSSNEPKIPLETKDGAWIPHATIMKTSADKKNMRKLQIMKEGFLVHEESIQCLVPIVSIDLLSMTEKDTSSYYKSYSSIVFSKEPTDVG